MKRFNPLLPLAVLLVSLAIALYLTLVPRPNPLGQPAGPLAAAKGYGVTLDLTRYSPDQLDQVLAQLQAQGLLWLRQPIRWAELEPEPNRFDWQKLDQVFEALARAQTEAASPFELIAVLHTAPAWARPSHSPATSPPRDPADFGRFGRAFALRYGNRRSGQTIYYQIWDEPNLSANWGRTYVEASAYARLLREAALQIRAVDSRATIILAALAPTLEEGPLNLSDISYLDQLYQLNAGPWFDVVAGQGYGFDRDAADPAQVQVLNFRRVELLRRVMLAHGEAETPVWLTAFGWNALPADWSGPKSPWKTGPVPKQAQRTGAAITLARRDWPWLGPMLAIGWDTAHLAESDPARGFALSESLLILAALRSAALGPPVATLGQYPVTHASGRYSPGWRFAGLVADPPGETGQLKLYFEGTRLDLLVNRGAYRGYLWIRVDGRPADALPQNREGQSYLVLYDPRRGSEAVTVAQNLAPGRHEATITADGGWGQWPLAGWRVYHEAGPAVSFDHRLSVGLLVLGLVAALSSLQLTRRLLQSLDTLARPLAGGLGCLPLFDKLPLVLVFALALAGYLMPGGLGLSFGLLLSLALLLRPEAGLILIAFGLSFLPNQKTVFGEVSLLEGVLFSSLGGVLLGRSRMTSSRPFLITPLSLPVLALLLISLLATVLAQDFGVSMFAWRTIVLGAVLFYALIGWLPETKNFGAWLLVDAFVAGTALHAAMALLLYFFNSNIIAVEGVRRAVGPIYPTPNNLALYLDRGWPIMLAVSLLPGPSKMRRRLYAVALVVTGGALYLTFSRGAVLLGLPVGLTALTLLHFAPRQAWSWRRGLALAGLGTWGLGILLWPLAGTARLLALFDPAQGSSFFRLKVWQSALMMLTDHPWLGVGLDNFLYQYRTVYILPPAWQEPNLSHPHNVVLEFATQLGLGAVVILLWLLFAFYATAWPLYRRKSNPLLLGLMSSMAVILGHGLVDQAFFQVDLAFSFFLIIGLVQRAGLRL
jgi:O-antigen ligase